MKMTMTPDKARELLARNPNNRNMSKKLAQKYAGDMKEGMWLYNGDPIRVSKAGDLLDGQHRLEACVISGMSFDTELIGELDDKIMPTIDNGRRRSAGDAIHILTGGSAQNNAGIAASTRQILNYVCGFAPNQPQSTPAIIRMINRYPEIADAYRLGMRTKGILTPGPLGAVLFLGQRAPTMGDRAVAFVDGIHSGAGLAAGDPRLAVREAFINRRTTAPGIRMPDPIWCFIATARGWNAFATGQELDRISVRKNADGTWNIPDIIGGPPRGEGVESLNNVRAGRRSVREKEVA